MVGTLRETTRLAADESGSVRMIEHLKVDPKSGPSDSDETRTYGPGGVIRRDQVVVRWKGGTSRYVADFGAKSVRVRYTRPGLRGNYEADVPPGPPDVLTTPRRMAAVARGGAPFAWTSFSVQNGRWRNLRMTLAGREEGHVVLQTTDRWGSRVRIRLDEDLYPQSIAQSAGDVYVRTAFHREPTIPTRTRPR